MPTVLEALSLTIQSKRATHNGSDLLARWTPEMETQINVAVGNGKRVEDKPGVYNDGEFDYYNIRVPKQADSEPVWKDYQIQFPVDLYAEAIGCTGWNWVRRCSQWVGFDFDSITGHAQGVGVSDAPGQQ